MAWCPKCNAGSSHAKMRACPNGCGVVMTTVRNPFKDNQTSIHRGASRSASKEREVDNARFLKEQNVA